MNLETIIQKVEEDINLIHLISPYTVFELIANLEPHLTSSSGDKRSFGLDLITKQMNWQQQSLQTLTLLNEFYTSRIDDYECLPSVLKGLLILPPSYKALQKLFSTGIRTMTVNTRTLAFQYIKLVVESNIKVDELFVKDFIFAMDGEKDPRNLYILFETVSKIVKTMDCARYAKDLYEVVFCYFPISFTQPKDMPYGISSDHLKRALRESVVCTDLFKDFIVEELIEKLQSLSKSAQKDSIQIIIDSLPVYGGEVYVKFQKKIWSDAKQCIAQKQDVELQLLTLKLLRQLCVSFSRTVTFGKGALETFLEMVCDDCLNDFKTPERYGPECGKILQSIGSSSKESFEIIIIATLPAIIGLLQNEQMNMAKSIYLGVIVDLLMANRLLHPNGGGVMVKYLQNILELLIQSLTNENLKVICLKGITQILYADFVNIEQQSELVQHLTNAVVMNENELVSNTAVECLVELKYRDLLMDVVYEILFGYINSIEDMRLKYVLDVFKGSFYKIDSVVSLLGQKVLKKDPNSKLFLATIFKISIGEEDSLCAIDFLLECLELNIFEFLFENDTTESFCQLFAFLVQSMGPDQTRRVWTKCVNLNQVLGGIENVPVNEKVCLLFECFFANIRRGIIDLDHDYLFRFIDKAVATDNSNYIKSCGISVACLLNKNTDEYAITFTEDFLKNDFFETDSKLIIFAYIVKSFIIRNDFYGYKLAEMLYTKDHLSRSLEILCDDSIKKQGHQEIKRLWKQKFYNFNIDKLLKKYTVDNDLESLASVFVLQKSIEYKYNFQKIIPLISVSLNHKSLLKVGLDTFTHVLQKNPEILGDLEEVVTILLEHVDAFKNGYEYELRVLIMNALGSVCGQVDHVKDRVLRATKKVLDDPKRGVRQAGARARSRWYLVK